MLSDATLVTPNLYQVGDPCYSDSGITSKYRQFFGKCLGAFWVIKQGRKGLLTLVIITQQGFPHRGVECDLDFSPRITLFSGFSSHSKKDLKVAIYGNLQIMTNIFISILANNE